MHNKLKIINTKNKNKKTTQHEVLMWTQSLHKHNSISSFRQMTE